MWQQKNSLPYSKPRIAVWTNWKSNLRISLTDIFPTILIIESTFVILLERMSAKVKGECKMEKIKIDLGFATLAAENGIDIRVYADKYNEDYTHHFEVGVYEED